MRKMFMFILALSVSVVAEAQGIDDDYRLYKFDDEMVRDRIVETDTLIFYRSTHARRDLYDEITAYRFAYVDFARRGHYYTSRAATLNGISVRHLNLPLLRGLGLAERGYAGLSHGCYSVAGMVGEDEFSTLDGVPVSGARGALFFSGKGYLGGVRAGVNALMHKGWSASVYASLRGGDDIYVKGVYRNTADVGLRLNKEFYSGAIFSLVALATVGERGLRSGSTEEAFTLVGDRLYNPAWGYQAKRERNSRTRNDAVPFVVTSLAVPIGDATQLLLSAGGDYGHRKYSTLGWYDAMTPRPDNYRYMPSYYTSQHIASSVAEQWRAGNSDYTQLRWDDMYNQNRMATDGATYALDSRVQRIVRGEAMANFQTTLGERVVLRYGVRAGYNSSRNYKQMEDLMGATHLDDIDYYLLDDDTFSRMLRNNLQDENLAVGEGDRFSYDYDLRQRTIDAFLQVEYAYNRWSVEADLQVGSESLFRKGYFEKELFPDNASYGRSDILRFNPYVASATVGYAFSPRHHLRVSAMTARVAPEAEHVFLNPLYNNRVVDNPTEQSHLAAEVEYKFTSADVDFIVTSFYNSTRNQRQTMRLYDDLSRTYCDVDISHLGTICYGVEMASEVRFTSNLRASLAASAGRYIYAENPIVTHYADTDNSIVSNSSPSYMGDCYVGGAPQISFAAELTYLTYRGWAASLGVQLAAARYIDPSVVRRTERVAIQGSTSEEIYHRFISQRRFDDAFTMDASLSRWFNFGPHRLSLTLSVRNLLGNRDIVYGGYESSRIRNYRSGAQRVYLPQDDVLTYAYPRTLYAVVSWKF